MNSQPKGQTDAERVLKLAKESPIRVAAHDKAGWLALFARTAEIEDPVGSSPYKRNGSTPDPLELFYETLIAPNGIDMKSALDVVAGNEVARDVMIRTTMPNGSVTDVAAYLLYEIVSEDGELRLGRIGAHWEMGRTLLGTMAQGMRGLASVMAVSWRMLRVQGFWGMMGYSRGMLPGIGEQGTDAVEKFVVAVAGHDTQAMAKLFTEHDAEIEWPIGQRLRPSEFLSQLPAGARWRFERPQNSGYVTACRYTLTGDREQTGIAFFYFDKDSRRIARARFFAADSSPEAPAS